MFVRAERTASTGHGCAGDSKGSLLESKDYALKQEASWPSSVLGLVQIIKGLKAFRIELKGSLPSIGKDLGG